MEIGHRSYSGDVIIIGGGLAGIVTALCLIDRGVRVVMLDRDRPERLGGLARESFGGVMMVDTPLQRRSGIRDDPALALADWHGAARFGEGDEWPKQWAGVYVTKSREMIWDWLVRRSVRFMPAVNWPERGLFRPGNSLPRWHIAWGTGPGIVGPLLRHLNGHPYRDLLDIRFHHRVERLVRTNGSVTGCAGRLEEGEGTFEAEGGAVVVAAGGICGGDLTRVRRHWYPDWGAPPETLLNGSHRFADGLLHDQVGDLGGTLTHLDKQWHYAAGITHPKPDRPSHGLSLVPPRSALWVNAKGERIGPVPLMTGTDTRYLVERICRQPGRYSFQILNWRIAARELAVSGCDYMTAFRERRRLRILREMIFGNRDLVRRLLRESQDFVVAGSVPELVRKINEMGNPYTIDPEVLEAEIRAYDEKIDRGRRFFNDDQLRRLADFRAYRWDRVRLCRFQKIVDPGAMPLIAIRLFILSRKSLGGIQTDLSCRVLDGGGRPIPGLFAVGESAGFGGGGIHGVGALEGTFLGSCVLTGQMAAAALSGENP